MAKFVFVTGGTTAEDQAALNRLPWPVLRKPVKGDHLIEVVSSFLLDQEEDTGSEDPTGPLVNTG